MSAQIIAQPLSAKTALRGNAVRARPAVRAAAARTVAVQAKTGRTILIGLAADSGCGKSTFMRRMTNLFGGSAKPIAGGNPDSNTLISDTTTVICLDDYHCHDREGRKVAKVTALDLKAQDFGATDACSLTPRLPAASWRQHAIWDARRHGPFARCVLRGSMPGGPLNKSRPSPPRRADVQPDQGAQGRQER